ncbi:MAG: ATP-binding protein [Proteobacteria bacterium]|nr:ATP-binding protein [Pseudomonadota bacterium]
MHQIDLIIIGTYLVMCLGLGLFRVGKIRDITEYTIGDRNLPNFILISTVFATTIGAVAILGRVEKMQSLGFFFALSTLFFPLGPLVLSFLFRNVRRFQDCISISDIMEKLYGKFSGNVVSALSIMISIGALSAQVTAISAFFKFIEVDYIWGTAISCFVIILYAASGGVKAVSFTDVLQFSVFAIAFPVVAGYIAIDLGGISAAFSKLPDNYFSFDLSAKEWMLFFSVILYATIVDINPVFAQRILMAKDARQVSFVFRAVSILYIPFALTIAFFGIVIKAKFPDMIDTKNAMLYPIISYLKPGLIGLMIAGILAVIMSTADSWVNNAGVTFAHDIYKKIFPHAVNEVQVARISTIIFGFISLVIAYKDFQIVDIVFFINSIWFPIVVIPCLAGFLGFNGKSRDFIASFIMALICIFFSYLWVGNLNTITMVFGLIGSFIGFFSRTALAFRISFRDYVEFLLFLLSSMKKMLINVFRVIPFSSEKLTKISICTSFFSVLNVASIFVLMITDQSYNNSLIFYIHVFSSFIAIASFSLRYYFSEAGFAKIMHIVMPFCLLSTMGISFKVADNISVVLYSLVNFLIVFCILIQIFSFGKTFFMCFSFISAGWIVASIYNMPALESDFMLYTLIISLIIFISLLYFRMLAAVIQKQIFSVFASAISHEVLSPLSDSVIISNGVLDISKDITKEKSNTEMNMTSDSTASNKIINDVLSHTYDANQMMQQMIEDMKERLSRGIKDIRMLITALKGSEGVESDIGNYSVYDTILEAIQSFFINQDQKVIFQKSNKELDFLFYGSKTNMLHVFYNIMKNAFQHGGRSDITLTIWIDGKSVYLQDNGKGVDKKNRMKIFKQYISSNSYGIGLSFVKAVMGKIGGDVSCIESRQQEGEGALFVLDF